MEPVRRRMSLTDLHRQLGEIFVYQEDDCFRHPEGLGASCIQIGADDH